MLTLLLLLPPAFTPCRLLLKAQHAASFPTSTLKVCQCVCRPSTSRTRPPLVSGGGREASGSRHAVLLLLLYLLLMIGSSSLPLQLTMSLSPHPRAKTTRQQLFAACWLTCFHETDHHFSRCRWSDVPQASGTETNLKVITSSEKQQEIFPSVTLKQQKHQHSRQF